MTPPDPAAQPLRYGQPIPPGVWEAIRTEYGLPTLAQVRDRLSTIHADPEPIMHQLVRIFVGEETLCPGFQFTESLEVKPAVRVLFARAMELRIAHNYFSAWMATPCPELEGRHPVNVLHGATPPLLHALESFSRR